MLPRKDACLLLYIAIGLWLMQVSPYLIGSVLNNGVEQSFFVYRGAIGIAQDLISYGFQINHALSTPTLFHVDASTINAVDLNFADGNLTTLYCSLLLKVFGSLNMVLLFAPLPVLVLTVLLLYKLVKVWVGKANVGLVVFLTVLLFLTGVDDFLGIKKLYWLVTEGFHFKTGTNHLPMGYMQRFPNAQVSYVAFLWWLYLSVKFYKSPSFKLYVFLPVSLAVLHYVYFYYWTYALLVSGFLFLWYCRKNVKESLFSLLVYLLLTAPFWIVVQRFVTNSMYPDYCEKVAVFTNYAPWFIHVSSIVLLLIFTKGRSVLFHLIPLLLQILILATSYVFQPYHVVYTAVQVLVPLAVIMIGIRALALERGGKVEYVFLFINYLAMFLMVNLIFIFDFNIQPFHWVYIGYYPLLIIAFVFWLSRFVKKKKFVNIMKFTTVFVLGVALINGFVYARSEHKFWRITTDELEVIEFLNERNEQDMIAGNNFAAISSIAVNTGHKIFMGQGHLSDLTRKEATLRFVENFKLLGYSNAAISKEYNAYRIKKGYMDAYVSNADSLALTWLENTTIVHETILHYWHDPGKYEERFNNILNDPNKGVSGFAPQYVLVYKPTSI